MSHGKPRSQLAPHHQTKLLHDTQPADAVVRRLFSTLSLTERTRLHSPEKTKMADGLERQAWGYLMHYLTTSNPPNLRSFASWNTNGSK
jgi:hypothetical protein